MVSAYLLLGSHCVAFSCYETSSSTQSVLTTQKIITKTKEVLREYKDYKSSLETKKKEMIEFLRTVKGIEALMKANQIKRKEILKSWQDTAGMHRMPKP